MIYAGLLFGDQSDLIFVKNVIPSPVDEHQNPIAKAYHAKDVQEDPDYPGDESAERYAPDARDRRIASDGSKQALVFVMKRFQSLTIDNPLDVPGSCLSLLDGDRGQHWQWLTISIEEISSVSKDENFGMPGELQCGRDLDPSRTCSLNPKRI